MFCGYPVLSTLCASSHWGILTYIWLLLHSVTVVPCTTLGCLGYSCYIKNESEEGRWKLDCRRWGMEVFRWGMNLGKMVQNGKNLLGFVGNGLSMDAGAALMSQIIKDSHISFCCSSEKGEWSESGDSGGQGRRGREEWPWAWLEVNKN